jgi:hypothetical protein
MNLLQFYCAVVVGLLALDEEILTALVKRGIKYIKYSQKEAVDVLGFMVFPHSYR